jgi:hypothetical protein
MNGLWACWEHESMDGMDRLSILLTPEYRSFLIGAGFFLLAVLSAYFDACPGRGGIAYRAKDPKSFWFGVSIYFLAGAYFWIRFMYQQ